jgi:prepilin-type N-terminal cleavage/methylation domain-containing protein/prepilin-type processing-associated H-X9-DG protein
MSAQRPARGFTLIELLVVIAIIAILAAILFPVFAKAREKARTSSCGSNNKQIALGLVQYTQDFDERYPNGTTGVVSGFGWSSQVVPYLKSGQIFGCPSDITPKPNDSYGLNINLGGQALAALNSPSSTVEVFEISGLSIDPTVYNTTATSSPAADGGDGGLGWIDFGNGAGPANYATGVLGSPQVTSTSARQYSANGGRHTVGANYAFADGHVKWELGANLSPGLNATASGSAQASPQAAGTSAAGFGGTFSVN